jgi:hypothetical protein
VIGKYGTLPKTVVAVDFDLAWQQQPCHDVALMIDAIASRYHSWSNEIVMWGSENGNRIHVAYENARIVDIACRIAIPQDHNDFANGVITLAIRCDWLLVLSNDALAEPNLDVLPAAARGSNAARFASNPIEFLKGLSSGKFHLE